MKMATLQRALEKQEAAKELHGANRVTFEDFSNPPKDRSAMLLLAARAVLQAREDGTFGADGQQGLEFLEKAVERFANPAAILGASGGSVKSKAKAAAARKNGRRGGRPKKVSR